MGDPAIQLFSTDLDGTLLGNEDAARRFKRAWTALAPGRRPLLVYNSGRLFDDLRRFVTDGTLPAADYYIGGVGTQVFAAGPGRMLAAWDHHLADGWDLARVREIAGRFPGVTPQPDEFQHAFKSSWFLKHARPHTIHELERQLAAAGVDAQVVYSSNRDLDVLPLHATKGGALAWLCAQLPVPLTRVLVAGDTGNDTSMFRLPGVRGIIVGNALPELPREVAGFPTYRSRRDQADGVLDGLRHYGVISAAPANQPAQGRS